MKKDKRVDQYIAKQADFAKPILTHIREVIHKACPEVEETIKWGAPAFEYKGPICGIAGFKAHCALFFTKASLFKDAELLKANQAEAMGHIGKITSIKDLPSQKILSGYVKEAMKINESGLKVPKKKVVAEDIIVPDELTKALNKNREAKAVFDAFSPSHRKEYVSWITEAKTETTRDKRIATTIEWLLEGKDRNWKYRK